MMTTPTALAPEPIREHALPSGRSVVVRLAGAAEEIEVRSPAGDVEVRITLTDAGPVVSLRAARLELSAADTLTLDCQRLAIQAKESAALHTGGALRVSSADEMHLNGKMINLNC